MDTSYGWCSIWVAAAQGMNMRCLLNSWNIHLNWEALGGFSSLCSLNSYGASTVRVFKESTGILLEVIGALCWEGIGGPALESRASREVDCACYMSEVGKVKIRSSELFQTTLPMFMVRWSRKESRGILAIKCSIQKMTCHFHPQPIGQN